MVVIRAVFCFLSIKMHYFFFKIKVFASNELKIGNNTFMWKSKIQISGKKNTITLGDNVNFRAANISVNGNNNRIIISDKVKFFESCCILIEGSNCEIYIGSKTTIGSADIFCGESNTAVFIGEDCMFGRQVSMNTSDFHSILDNSNRARINPPKNIYIGDHVWIGFGATVKKGATIQKDSIIASGAIVGSKEYPSNIILGGIPAKILKENITWSREKLPY